MLYNLNARQGREDELWCDRAVQQKHSNAHGLPKHSRWRRVHELRLQGQSARSTLNKCEPFSPSALLMVDLTGQ